MIYTVTFNPSLDYVVGVEDFQMGKVNRTCSEVIFPGGKGINVSMVLKELGVDSVPLGFLAGFTGCEIKRLLQEKGIVHSFLETENGLSRINVKIRSLEKNTGMEKVEKEGEINGMGPVIDNACLDAFMTSLDSLTDGDILVLAGSIPSSLPSDMYRNIMERLQYKKVKVVVDATKDLLLKVLEFHPFLIKPNDAELGELFGVKITNKDDVVIYAKKLREMGAENVLVSMAGEGAVLVARDGSVYMSDAPKGTVVNSVGAGDSMVAGFLYGYLKGEDYKSAFYYGLCTGSASAFSENLATQKEVEALLANMKL